MPGVSVPSELPACPSLRNEPCQPYQAIVNDRELRATGRPEDIWPTV